MDPLCEKLKLNHCFICISSSVRDDSDPTSGAGHEVGKNGGFERREYEILFNYLVWNNSYMNGRSTNDLEGKRRTKVMDVLLNSGKAAFCSECGERVKAVIALHLELENIQMKLLRSLESLKKLIVSKSMFGDDEEAKCQMTEMENLLEENEAKGISSVMIEDTLTLDVSLVKSKKVWMDAVRDFQAAVFENNGDFSNLLPLVSSRNTGSSVPDPDTANSSSALESNDIDITVKEEVDFDIFGTQEDDPLQPTGDYVDRFLINSIWNDSEITAAPSPSSNSFTGGDLISADLSRSDNLIQQDLKLESLEIPQKRSRKKTELFTVESPAPKNSNDNAVKISKRTGPRKTSLAYRLQRKELEQKKMKKSSKKDGEIGKELSSSSSSEPRKKRRRRGAERRKTLVKLSCELCSYSVYSKFNFIQHLREHETEEKKLQCTEPDCEGAKFTTEQYFEYHMKLHTSRPHFWICSVCEEHVPPPVFHKHMQNHDKASISCPFCYYSHPDLPQYILHLCSHQTKGKVLPCPLCSSTFKGHKMKLDLKSHLRKEHKRKDLLYKCEYKGCKKSFNTRETLMNHLHIHLESFKCSEPGCSEKFTTKGNLKIHVQKVHLKVQNIHECTLCNQGFATEGQLDKHRILEHNYPKYICELCPGVEYFNHHSYRNHRQRHHGEGKHECKVCGKTFATRAQLTKHSLTHRQDNIICEQCGFVAKSSYHLKRHKVIHSDLPKYTCPHCPKRFHEKRNAEDHIKTHTGQRDYVCHVCSAAFIKKQAMTLHIKKNHPGT